MQPNEINIRFHPVADIFPMMNDREFTDLTTDIREHGLREPIWLHHDGRIIDGRNRWLACAEVGLEPDTRTTTATTPTSWRSSSRSTCTDGTWTSHSGPWSADGSPTWHLVARRKL
jgi:hypothetical protein